MLVSKQTIAKPTGSPVSQPAQPVEEQRQRRGSRLLLLLMLLLGGLVLTITLAVTLGPVPINPLTVWQIIGSHLFGTEPGEWSRAHDQIVWLIRLPRVLLAAVIGAGLAVVGTAMQATVRNPIADPYILGISAGASIGAVLVILFGLQIFGLYSLSIAAFLGALAAFAIVFTLAQQQGRLPPIRLILVGVAASYVFSAITSFLIFRAHDTRQTQAVLFWLAGSVASAKWSFLLIPTVVIIVGTVILVLQARSMNALVAGGETAITLGVDTNRFRKELMALSALLTGVMVAVAGAIGFVGLIMPHAVRLFVGADHRRVLPVSVLVGAIFLIWVDVLARTIVAPEELPLGVITAFVGGPFFLWLLRRRGQAFGGSGR